MYRLLKREKLLGHRGHGKKPKYLTSKTKTEATQSNQVWCWDITYLRTPVSKQYYYLYSYIDIFSRKIVGTAIHETEDGSLAADLLEQCLKSEGISGQNLRLHSDSGGPMRGRDFIARLQKIGVVLSRSRPRVSDDNPFIEAFFKTLKYSPTYPLMPFMSLNQAKGWLKKFIHDYNHVNLHSGINYVTPMMRHQGLHIEHLLKRKAVFAEAKLQNPLRWSKHAHQWSPDKMVQIHPASCRMTKSATTL